MPCVPAQAPNSSRMCVSRVCYSPGVRSVRLFLGLGPNQCVSGCLRVSAALLVTDCETGHVACGPLCEAVCGNRAIGVWLVKVVALRLSTCADM